MKRFLMLACALALLFTLSSGASARIVGLVYDADLAGADAFKAFLDGRGHPTTLIPVSAAGSTDLSPFETIVIGPDTGYLSDWSGDAATIAHINAAGKYTVGIGEGGYAFFGKLSLPIGWPMGWHGIDATLIAVDPTASVFSTPNVIPTAPTIAVIDSAGFVQGASIHLDFIPASVAVFGVEDSATDHSPLLMEGRYVLWGYQDVPSALTDVGRDLLENVIVPEPASLLWLAAAGLAALPPRRRA